MQLIALPQQGSPQDWPSTHGRPSTLRVSAGQLSGGHSIAGQSPEVQWPPSQNMSGQLGPPGVGQHAPQLAPSSLQGSPSLGSRPHQHTGSGSATAQFQVPASQVQNMPAPHAEPPLWQVAPSAQQALPGAPRFQGSMPAGHSMSHDQRAAVQTQPG
jgi:hypothetical protein